MVIKEFDESLSFAKPAFYKIPEEKQQRIIAIAKKEFAENGLTSTNINIVAKKADISIGSLYNYFETKENLFLTVAHQGLKEMVDSVMIAMSFSVNFIDSFKDFLKVLIRFIKEERELSLIYNDVAYRADPEVTLSTRKYAKENLINIYHSTIKRAQEEGYVRNDVDFRVITFILDAIFSSIRLAYTSDDENSLCVFVDEELRDDIDFFADEICKVLLRAFSAKSREQ